MDITLVALAYLAGCDDVGCPSGTLEMDGHCVRQTGQSTQTAGVASTEVMASGVAGTGTSSAVHTSATMSSSPSEAAAANPAGTDGASAAPASAASAMSVDPCQGRSNVSVCDGEVMYHCGSAGASSTRETCSSPMFCQFGLSSGKCAACSPGTFHCTGASLEKCGPDGQFTLVEQCASEPLCNVTAGACTTKACTPNTKVCSPAGVLQACNADGSALEDLQACGANMCDAQLGRCYECVPGSKTCMGSSVLECAGDGASVAVMDCAAAAGECMSGSCSTNSCTTSPSPAGSKCTGGVCDGSGKCVGCLSNANCDSNEVCMQSRCVAKACSPNATTCSSDGTLQTCNADGSEIQEMRPCGVGLCDARSKSCFDCVPNRNSCTGNTLIRCDSAGRQTSEICMPKNDCSTATCSGSACVSGVKPSGSACSGSGGAKYCDGRGNCAIQCKGDTDCGSGSWCDDGKYRAECEIPPNSTYQMTCRSCSLRHCVVSCADCDEAWQMNTAVVPSTWNLAERPCSIGLTNCSGRLDCRGATCGT